MRSSGIRLNPLVVKVRLNHFNILVQGSSLNTRGQLYVGVSKPQRYGGYHLVDFVFWIRTFVNIKPISGPSLFPVTTDVINYEVKQAYLDAFTKERVTFFPI